MAFNFEHRPYSGENFRPRPEVHVDRDAKLILVATSWGPRGTAKKVIDRMLEYLLNARQDNEVTSPFERLTCLSDAANNLRTAAFLANEMIFREDNADEYHAGVELFGAVLDENEIVWLQIGNPQLLLARKQRGLVPLGSYLDLAFDLSAGELLPALPNQLLGLDTTLNPTMGQFRVQSGDQLVLLSHSEIPQVIYNIERAELTLDNLSRILAQAHPDLAYWLGILEIEQSFSHEKE